MPVSLFKRLRALLAPDDGHAGIKHSLHDPRWGHRLEDDGRKRQEGRRPGKNNNDNEGPPDLDQLWRDFNQRLNRLFGKRDGGGPFRPDSRGVGITVSVVAVIVALIWLASGAFIVQDGQVGVVTTFGRLASKAGPGFNWRWPAPFQAHVIVNVAQVQTVEVGYRGNIRNKQTAESLMLTDDQNIADVQFSVQYKVKDPVAWVFNNRDQVKTIHDAAESVVRGLVGANKLDYVLYEGRDRIARDAVGRIQQMADRYGLGAEIAGVTVLSAAAPDAVAPAFEETVKAREDRSRERSEAEAFANDIIPQAKARAAAMVQAAEAYRATVVATATGNAARFDQVVAEYARAPGVTRDRMYLDTMQQIFSSTSKIMIDAKTATTINLPLDRMLSQVASNEAAIGSRSGPVMPGQQAPQPMQPWQPPGQAQPQAPQPPPQQQAQPQPQQAQPAQPAPQAQPQQPQSQQDGGLPADSVRLRDPRSRENERERETR
jgi:membrane protease subunit HflK